MAELIPPQRIVTVLEVQGEETLQKAVDLRQQLDKKFSKPLSVNLDTSKAEGTLISFGKIVDGKVSELVTNISKKNKLNLEITNPNSDFQKVEKQTIGFFDQLKKKVESKRFNIPVTGNPYAVNAPTKTANNNPNKAIDAALDKLQAKAPQVFAKLDSLIEGSTDEFTILGHQVNVLKANFDRLELNPSQAKALRTSIADAEITLKKFGVTIEDTSKKQVRLVTQLRNLRNEIAKMDIAGQSGTQTFTNLQRQAARLEDQIRDNSSAIRILSSDTVGLDAGIGAIRGVVAGFTAYQGVLGLTGASQEEFEKTLLKINGAMAVLQGLQEIGNLLQKESIVRLYGSALAQQIWNASTELSVKILKGRNIQTVASTVATEANTVATIATATATATATVATEGLTGAQKALRVALLTSGIGALVVVIGGLIALNLKLYDNLQKLIHGFEDYQRVSEELGVALVKRLQTEEDIARVLKGGLNDREREIALLKEKGGNLDEINKLENNLINEEIANNKKRITELSKLNVNLSATAKAELRKRSDANRQFENEQLILNQKYNEDRVKASLDLSQKQAEINQTGTGVFSNELTTRLKLAHIAYQKDLLNYAGTESEKKRFAKLRANELAKEIITLTQKLDVLRVDFNPLESTSDQRAKNRDLFSKQAQGLAVDYVNAIEDGLRNPLPPSVRFAYEGLIKEIFLGENVLAKSKADFDKDLASIFKGIKDKALELSQRDKAKDVPVTSLGELLFGNIKEAEKTNAKYFDLFLTQALGFLDQQVQAQIDADNRLIQSQENRIQRNKELAEYGTAEQLQIEEERLAELQRQREKDIQKQKQIAAAQLLINNAVTVSETIKAVAKAFGEGNLLTGILTSAALAATIFSTISSVSSAFGSVPAFAEGVDRLHGPGSTKSDSINARLSKDEAVLSAEQNKAMNYDPNSIKVRKYLIGHALTDGSYRLPNLASSLPIPGASREDRESKELMIEQNKKLDQIIKMTGKGKVSFNITNEGIHAAVETVVNNKQRREDKRG